ncbi:sulfite exporter TauE/SafE family protein [Actibacterium sp. XHP0104]|uniref:sulfite exporter TauE/SafE family protein n=1 Tax=Actibacterium sp. XHP0104 TaxID=2984335 RepID=UPI0021E7CC13|nr:sulfite exporter TauE/SafE family protein [Actibacterium sp. XHP0104]MCV2882685.1 sulfite exporter TauE/SafE family protein [Actibacterium sp. XHP0104]
MAVGFFAQLADGALGMGFGFISSTILLGQGVAPALVSASVNAAKLPTGIVAAVSHHLNRNTDWALARRLALWGVIGGLAGATVLSFLKAPLLTLVISAYLIFMGALIALRGLRGAAPRVIGAGRNRLIGACGGLIEGIGGSWGPVVTSSLLGSGVAPRVAIGSSAFAELVVSGAVFATLAVTFSAGIWGQHVNWAQAGASVAGLICGGLPAAMLGGKLARHAPRRTITVIVGLMAMVIGAFRLAEVVG